MCLHTIWLAWIQFCLRQIQILFFVNFRNFSWIFLSSSAKLADTKDLLSSKRESYPFLHKNPFSPSANVNEMWTNFWVPILATFLLAPNFSLMDNLLLTIAKKYIWTLNVWLISKILCIQKCKTATDESKCALWNTVEYWRVEH